jgi:hypothetical protein
MWGKCSSWTVSSHPPDLYDDLLTKTTKLLRYCQTKPKKEKSVVYRFCIETENEMG